MGRVTKSYGTANGQTIIFTHREGNRWEAEIPWAYDGEYVTEIYAEDEAGNVGYLCTMLFIISGHELWGYIVPRGFTGSVKDNQYSGMPTIQEFFADVAKRETEGCIEETKYQAEVQEGGYKIERVICVRHDD